MPKFAKVETQVDFPAQERETLSFWSEINAFEQLRAKIRGKPKWSFLDGPITANNPMGVHHAWGRTYKDVYQRYFAMTGHDQRFQNGFDCQGLWVEVEVEKELGLKTKRDIENLAPGDRFASIDRFVRLCKERVDKFARIQSDQSIRLGQWMDWDRTDADWAKPVDERKSYFTMSQENNYTIWSFLKKCHERKLVYRGYDAMPWCSRCGVGISQMEMHEGYKLVAHRSVFVKFPLRGRPGENLLAWTTTPWTLSSNVAAAVNPELTYLKVKSRDEIYFVAKGAFTAKRKEEEFKRKEWVDGVPKLRPIEQHFKEKGPFEIVGEVKGADMLGWQYDGPFDELEAQSHAYGFPEELADVVQKQKWAPAVSGKEAHRVIAWKDVGETEGTGIVHIAPGCGREDFELGKEQGVPPIAPLDEYGTFRPGFGPLSGKSAVDPATAEWIIKNLQEKGRLFASELYPHTYPHCWRCKTELLFRLVDEWYISMSWRDEIMDVTRQVTFLPESINGQARELDWLKNMGDWMISKKRFWGLALPIWVDEQTGDFEVIGSRQELKERAVEGWSEFEGHTPHRPWIDKVKIRNPKTGNLMSRIPDVGNPWLDAGIVPYSTMGFNRDRAEWEKWFPADFITEAFPGQFRNWFYATLAMSTMMTNRAPFKVLLGHAMVRDQNGEEMHKAKGNSIAFDGAAETGYELFTARDSKLAVDAQAKRDLPSGFRSAREDERRIDGVAIKVVVGAYPPIGADVIRWMYCRQNPAANINFGPGPADELRAKFHLKLWNSYAFFVNYARLDGFDPSVPAVPVGQRPDIDRWILSDLQLLIRASREAYEAFDTQRFCGEAERFIDEKLSNWYIRRNRRRFWKSEKGRDKDAAYQTLYEVLTTFNKLIAPVVPFLAESIWQNLRAETAPRSVHLCDFPVENRELIDEQLSADVESLLELVTVGSKARNAAKIKVRQPLAELRVGRSKGFERAVERFSDQVCDELNIRKATIVSSEEIRSNVKVRFAPDRKILGPVLGKKLEGAVREILRISDAGHSLKGSFNPETGENEIILTIDGQETRVPYVGIREEQIGPDGWQFACEGRAEVLLDMRITEELKLAGYAREIIRHVQELRKTAGLEMEDRIILALSTESPALQKAIEIHRDFIASECLVKEWATNLEGDDVARANVVIDGQALAIALRRAK